MKSFFQLNFTVDVKLNDPKGTVRGHVLDSFNGNEYFAFQNIPYAQPPVNNLRFQVSYLNNYNSE